MNIHKNNIEEWICDSGETMIDHQSEQKTD